MSVRELEPFVNDGMFWVWQSTRADEDVVAAGLSGTTVALAARWVIDWEDDRFYKVIVTKEAWEKKYGNGNGRPTDALLNEFVPKEPFEIEGVGMVRLLLPESGY